VAVYFRGSDVFAFGDVFTTDYPSIGIAQGGTVENFIDNYNLALQITTPNTIFLPGHAQLSKREDVIAVRDAITIIHGRFLEMVKRGMTLEQIREARHQRNLTPALRPRTSPPTRCKTAAVGTNRCSTKQRVISRCTKC